MIFERGIAARPTFKSRPSLLELKYVGLRIVPKERPILAGAIATLPGERVSAAPGALGLRRLWAQAKVRT
jgi:hypothetical protein